MQKMTSDEIKSFLAKGTRTGKLSTVRADGRPHVAPIWFVLDGDDLLFNTGLSTVKAKNMLRDNRVSICVDDDTPPFAFVIVEGTAVLQDNPPDNLAWATQIGGRYMGADQAETFGKRNAVPGECLVRITPTKVIAQKDLAS